MSGHFSERVVMFGADRVLVVDHHVLGHRCTSPTASAYANKCGRPEILLLIGSVSQSV